MKRIENSVKCGILLLLLCVNPVGAETVPMLEWLRDTEKLRTEVLEPLTEEFRGADCVPSFGHHADRYLARLQAIRSDLNSTSYLLFREIILITGQDVGRFFTTEEDAGICNQWDAWSGVLRHVENKLEFIGNILALSGWRR